MSGFANLFATAYTAMVSQRAALGLAALQPAVLTNFQFGPEYLEQDQVSPRIVIVPLSSEFNFAQPLPAAYRAGTSDPVAKSLFTRVESFEAHVWGDPDSDNLDPALSFDTAVELVREFCGAMYTVFMGGRGAPSGFCPTGGAWRVDPRQVGMINTYGRLYVLTFTLSLQVQRDAYISIPYAVTPTDGGVKREIVRDISDPVTGDNPQTVTPTIEVPS